MFNISVKKNSFLQVSFMLLFVSSVNSAELLPNFIENHTHILYTDIDTACRADLGSNYTGHFEPFLGRTTTWACFCFSNPGNACALFNNTCSYGNDVNYYQSGPGSASCHIHSDTGEKVCNVNSSNVCPLLDDECPVGTVLNLNTNICEIITLPSTPQVEPIANKGDCERDCNVGNGTNPINGATGNKYQREIDYSSSVSHGLRFERYYNSESAELRAGIAGTHWRGTYDRSIDVTLDTTSSETIIVNYRPDGQGVFFIESNGSWIPTIDLTLQLVELINVQDERVGWELIDSNDMVEAYNTQGQLISMTNRQGQIQTLDYNLTLTQGGDDDTKTLDRVTDPYGRTLTFIYDADGLLSELIGPDNNVYKYSYDANLNLSVVTYPDETLVDNTDNPTRIYHYENSNFVHALTGITDETGQRFASWGYDTQGRAIYSEHANGTERSDVVYNGDGTTTITHSSGQVRTYHYETHSSVHLMSQVEGEQCSHCGGMSKVITYDANGFVASRTDFNNNVTTYINDARGLELSRTEAVGTPEERTITKEWHATFRLPTKITEPGKITTYDYDNQGRLLTKQEKAL